MDYSKAIEPVTVLKTKSAELIRKARESGQPIVITQNGKPTAVLQDVESFQHQRKALLLLRYLATGDRELQKGKGVAHGRAKRHFEKKLRELQGD
jgi:prevent-host-death family protein